jgi:DNA-binding MarR family transcriptional regulator
MKVKEDTKLKFVDAMQNLNRALKNESERCGEIFGGLSEKEITVVAFVGQNQVVKMSDIADNIDAPMSTLTNIVDKLVEKELLAREHSSEDRRAINVTLSAAGKSTFKSLITEKKQIAEKMLAQLSEKDQQAFIEHLKILTSYLGVRK